MEGPSLVFLLDMARTRSHLFFKFISTHPSTEACWHPFWAASSYGPERLTQYTRNSVGANDAYWKPGYEEDSYAAATADFLAAIARANEQNKTLIVNEHCQILLQQKIALAVIREEPVPTPNNPTILPDDVLKTLTPVFVIRNPVFSVPSLYAGLIKSMPERPWDEDWVLKNATVLQRRMFDFFLQRDKKAPTVVNGDDVVWRTDAVKEGVCTRLGLDPAGVSEVWEPKPESARHSDGLIRLFLQTIDDSTGIIRPSEKPPVADLDTSHAKWSDDWGTEVAHQLKAMVELDMPHFEYMNIYAV